MGVGKSAGGMQLGLGRASVRVELEAGEHSVSDDAPLTALQHRAGPLDRWEWGCGGGRVSRHPGARAGGWSGDQDGDASSLGVAG